MVKVARTFSVNQPVEVVVGFLKDFTATEQWDPGTKTCTRVDSGEIAVGSKWHNVSQFRGRETELDYTLRRFDPDHLTFVGENKTATSTDDMAFATQGSGGTSITYQATINFHGLAKLASPLMQRVFEKLADETVTQMTSTLNGLASNRAGS